jgi:hypothetical protein
MGGLPLLAQHSPRHQRDPVGQDAPAPLPGAGRVLLGPIPNVNVSCIEVAYDPGRELLWYATEVAGAGLAAANPEDLSVLVQVPTSGLDCNGDLVPDVTGALTGLTTICPETSGPGARLLGTDFNGDLSRFDDSCFLIDPTLPPSGGPYPMQGSARLLSVWYLDSAGCAATCRPNTNADSPQNRIDQVLAVSASSVTIGPGGSTGDLFVAGNFSTVLHRVSLSAGCPGSWRLLQTVPSPIGGTGVSGMSFDPELQSYWLTDYGRHQIYEATWDRLAGSFSLVQAFPRPASAVSTAAVDALVGTSREDPDDPRNLPLHALALSNVSNHVSHVVASGHPVGGLLADCAVSESGGTDFLDLELAEDARVAGLTYLAGFSLTDASGLRVDCHRTLPIDPGVLLIQCLSQPAIFRDFVAAWSGAGAARLSVALPSGGSVRYPLKLGFLTLGLPARHEAGVAAVSQPAAVTWQTGPGGGLAVTVSGPRNARRGGPGLTGGTVALRVSGAPRGGVLSAVVVGPGTATVLGPTDGTPTTLRLTATGGPGPLELLVTYQVSGESVTARHLVRLSSY